MPLEPPQPLHVLSVLRDQEAQLRQIVATHPAERAYLVALEHVAAAIGALETATATPSR